MSSEGNDNLHVLCKGGNIDAASSNGYTDLHYACGNGNIELARPLIENGADLNGRDYDGDTPLHGACHGGHVETARLLIEKGADVNSTDNWGDTPLEYACNYSSSIEIVQMLAHNGADISLVDKWSIQNADIRTWLRRVEGFTPLHFACFAGDMVRVRTVLHSDETENATILSAREVSLTKDVYEIMNKACQLVWRPENNVAYPTSFQMAAEALQNIFTETSRFQTLVSNDALIVELVLGYCDRSWFRPKTDFTRLKKRRKRN